MMRCNEDRYCRRIRRAVVGGGPTRAACSSASACTVERYAIHLAHDQDVPAQGAAVFFETGSKAGIQPHHASRLGRQLARLDLAKTADDMNVPGWRLHPLSTGHWSVWVNGNWRMTFTFEGTDAVLVDHQDYHYNKEQMGIPFTPVSPMCRK